MSIISTLGPLGSDAHQAAQQYNPDAELLFFNHPSDVVESLGKGRADFAIIPVYNTREGEIKEYFRLIAELDQLYWFDNMSCRFISLWVLSKKT